MNPRVIPKLAPDVSIKASPERTESFQDKWQGKFLLSKNRGRTGIASERNTHYSDFLS